MDEFGRFPAMGVRVWVVPARPLFLVFLLVVMGNMGTSFVSHKQLQGRFRFSNMGLNETRPQLGQPSPRAPSMGRNIGRIAGQTTGRTTGRTTGPTTGGTKGRIMPFMVCLFSIGLGSLPRAHAAVPSDIDSDLTEQLDAYSKHKRQALKEIDHTSLDRFKHEYKQYIHNKPRNKFEDVVDVKKLDALTQRSDKLVHTLRNTLWSKFSNVLESVNEKLSTSSSEASKVIEDSNALLKREKQDYLGYRV